MSLRLIIKKHGTNVHKLPVKYINIIIRQLLDLRHWQEWRRHQQLQNLCFDGLHRRRMCTDKRLMTPWFTSETPTLDSPFNLFLYLCCARALRTSLSHGGHFNRYFSAPCRSQAGPALHCCSRLDSATRQHAWISPHFRFGLCLLADWSTAEEQLSLFIGPRPGTVDTERKWNSWNTYLFFLKEA